MLEIRELGSADAKSAVMNRSESVKAPLERNRRTIIFVSVKFRPSEELGSHASVLPFRVKKLYSSNVKPGGKSRALISVGPDRIKVSSMSLLNQKETNL